ncbi:MAG: hypothetical protein ACRD2L_01195 [Terriglobia bacterium]
MDTEGTRWTVPETGDSLHTLLIAARGVCTCSASRQCRRKTDLLLTGEPIMPYDLIRISSELDRLCESDRKQHRELLRLVDVEQVHWDKEDR